VDPFNQKFSNHVAHTITNTNIIPSHEDDITVWKPSPNGICIAKQSFQFLNAENQVQLLNQGARSIISEALRIMRRVWKLRIYPPNLKTFFWRLIRQALATSMRAGKYSHNISKFCSTCNTLENDSHLFFECNLPKGCLVHL
jgi:hypothetical protein